MLTALILLPALGAAALLGARREETVRAVGAVATLATLAVSVAILIACRPAASIESHRLVERIAWSAAFGAEWFVGADALRAPLALLVALTGVLAVLADREPERGRTAGILVLLAALLGTILALDLLLLHAFWLAAVVTTGLLVAERDRASRFPGLDLAGCAAMLVALLVVRDRAGTLDLTALASADAFRETPALGAFVLAAFLAAFAAPMIRMSPAANSVSILTLGAWPIAGALGMLRLLPVTPTAAGEASTILATLAAVYVVLGGIRLLTGSRWEDIAIAALPFHAGLVVLGVAAAAAGAREAATGVVLLAVGFALGRVLLVLAARAPRWLVGVAALVAIGFPGTVGFAGAWIVLTAAAERLPFATAVAATGAVLAAAGVTRCAGRWLRDERVQARELGPREAWPGALLGALALALALAAAWLSAWIDGPVGRLLAVLAGGGGG